MMAKKDIVMTPEEEARYNRDIAMWSQLGKYVATNTLEGCERDYRYKCYHHLAPMACFSLPKDIEGAEEYVLWVYDRGIRSIGYRRELEEKLKWQEKPKTAEQEAMARACSKISVS